MLKLNKKKKKSRLPDRSSTNNRVMMRNQYFGDVRSTEEPQKFEPKKSPRKKFKSHLKLKRFGRRTVNLIIFVAALIFIWWLSLISTKSYNWSGESNLQVSSGYRGELKKFTNSQINNYTLLNLNSDKVSQAITEKFVDVQSAQVKKVWYKKGVDITITFRQPILKWEGGGESKFVDQNGVVVSLTPINQDSLFTITDESGLGFSGGEKVFADRNITFCGIVAGAVKSNEAVNGVFQKFSIPSGSLKEVDMDLNTGIKVKLSTELDPTEQVNTLAEVLTKLNNEGKKPAEYIDMRVSGKVYWK